MSATIKFIWIGFISLLLTSQAGACCIIFNLSQPTTFKGTAGSGDKTVTGWMLIDFSDASNLKIKTFQFQVTPGVGASGSTLISSSELDRASILDGGSRLDIKLSDPTLWINFQILFDDDISKDFVFGHIGALDGSKGLRSLGSIYPPGGGQPLAEIPESARARFMLTSVPEPESWILFVAGLILLTLRGKVLVFIPRSIKQMCLRATG
jgi:hypothetical protein